MPKVLRLQLTDLAVQKAKPKAKPYRLFDGGGLALQVQPSGVKTWQLRYREFGVREMTAKLGRLENLSLADARKRANSLRPLLEHGESMRQIIVAQEMKAIGERSSTFGAAREAWLAREARRAKWSAAHKSKVKEIADKNLAEFDAMPLTKITAAVVAPVLAKLEERAPHVFIKARRYVHAILDDAIEQGLILSSPLPRPRRRAQRGEPAHYPAVTALQPLGAILRAAEGADASAGVKRAHALLAFTAQRIGEVVPARWSEFDLDAATWGIPRARMKRRDPQRGPHLVPLPPALLEQLRAWRAADGDDADLVCLAPYGGKRHVTRESVEKFYRVSLKLAGKHSPHSWRAAFKSIASDAGKAADVVEAQLDHVVGTKVASAYDRAHRLELRRELMAWYEKTLIGARDGAEVVPITRERRPAAKHT